MWWYFWHSLNYDGCTTLYRTDIVIFIWWIYGKVGLFQWPQLGENDHSREIWIMGKIGGSLKDGWDKHPLHTMNNFLCKGYLFALDYFDIIFFFDISLIL